MERRAELLETGDLLFTLKDITYTPEKPRLKETFMVKGKVELFKLPFVLPIWVVATVTYPERWWEEIIPIIGGPEVSESSTVIGGDFEITFRKGFDREGDFALLVKAYAGPTFSLDKITIPPFPPVATEETTFMVAGEVPEEEKGIRNLRITGYSKDTGPMVTPPGVLELEVGDKCRVNLEFEHRYPTEIDAKFHVAIWQATFLDPHDEILSKETTFPISPSEEWMPGAVNLAIPITTAIEPGTYGLYGKIMGITGGDIFTEYLADVIAIIGIPRKPMLEVQSIQLS